MPAKSFLSLMMHAKQQVYRKVKKTKQNKNKKKRKKKDAVIVEESPSSPPPQTSKTGKKNIYAPWIFIPSLNSSFRQNPFNFPTRFSSPLHLFGSFCEMCN